MNLDDIDDMVQHVCHTIDITMFVEDLIVNIGIESVNDTLQRLGKSPFIEAIVKSTHSLSPGTLCY